MTYFANNKYLEIDLFEKELTRLFMACGLTLTKDKASFFFNELAAYPANIIRTAFKRLMEAPPSKMTLAAIKGAIKAVTPPKQEERKAVGCEYCDSVGLIQYVKVIGGQHYTFSARCHKCRTSPYTKEPFYNEVMPHDNIQPHSKREHMQPVNRDVSDVVRNITKRESEDYMTERARERSLWIEQQRDNVIQLHSR